MRTVPCAQSIRRSANVGGGLACGTQKTASDALNGGVTGDVFCEQAAGGGMAAYDPYSFMISPRGDPMAAGGGAAPGVNTPPDQCAAKARVGVRGPTASCSTHLALCPRVCGSLFYRQVSPFSVLQQKLQVTVTNDVRDREVSAVSSAKARLWPQWLLGTPLFAAILTFVRTTGGRPS